MRLILALSPRPSCPPVVIAATDFAMSDTELGDLIRRVRAGDPSARNELFEHAYADLHRRASIAVERMGRRSLDTTGLLHEAYLKLAGTDALLPEDRTHFIRIAAAAMRQVLVDRARRRLTRKRGEDRPEADIDLLPVAVEHPAETLLALDEALSRLEERDERLAQVVHLRFFAGYSVKETATLLGMSERTVKRDWRLARAFLYATLGREPDPPPEQPRD